MGYNHRMFNANLLREAQKLDSQALAEVHDMYYPQVYRYVAFRLNDPQAAEDITADVFLQLLEALRNPRSPIRDLRAWLLGTAHHLINDHLRKQYRRPLEDIEDHDALPDEASIESASEAAFHQEQINWALRQLTGDQQEVLALRFSQELSLDETARMMRKTVNAVKVLQFRALAAVRRLLEKRQVL